MENASKALIIAGAILLAIAIIGVGMYVFNNASDSVSGTDMTEEEVTAYNGDFDVYGGTIRGSRVKTLIDTVNNHNLTAVDQSETIQVMYDQTAEAEVNASTIAEDDADTTTTRLNEIKNTNIQSGNTYTVEFGYDGASGKITTIFINPVE